MQLRICLVNGKAAKPQVNHVKKLAGTAPKGLSWGVWLQNRDYVAQHKYRHGPGKSYNVITAGRKIRHVLEGQAELFGILYILGGLEKELEYIARTIILVQDNATHMEQLGFLVCKTCWLKSVICDRCNLVQMCFQMSTSNVICTTTRTWQRCSVDCVESQQ
jgi:hypothetical protein